MFRMKEVAVVAAALKMKKNINIKIISNFNKTQKQLKKNKMYQRDYFKKES